MNRHDINYWTSKKFDHVQPTDEELDYGRPIEKSQMARLLANEIKVMVERGFPLTSISHKVDQLARMVKDEEKTSLDHFIDDVEASGEVPE